MALPRRMMSLSSLSTSQSAVDAQQFMVSVDHQAGGSRILLERGDGIGVVPEQFFDMRGGPVATAQPDDSGRRTEQRRHVGKVRVLRHEREAVALGIVSKGRDHRLLADRAVEPDSSRETGRPVVDRV